MQLRSVIVIMIVGRDRGRRTSREKKSNNVRTCTRVLCFQRRYYIAVRAKHMYTRAHKGVRRGRARPGGGCLDDHSARASCARWRRRVGGGWRGDDGATAVTSDSAVHAKLRRSYDGCGSNNNNNNNRPTLPLYYYSSTLRRCPVASRRRRRA